MKLYHFSNGQYKKLIPRIGLKRNDAEDERLRNKACIWLTTNSDQVNGMNYVYRYGVNLNEEDNKLIKDESLGEQSINNEKWYGYLGEIILFDRQVSSPIFQYAKRFRQAIEKLTTNDIIESQWFGEFPKGCCGDTTMLLARYLLENQAIQTKYQWGIFNKQTHAWLELERNKMIIDITADQFDDVDEEVVFTDNKEWYEKFKNSNIPNAAFTEFQGPNKVRLEKLYSKIIKNID